MIAPEPLAVDCAGCGEAYERRTTWQRWCTPACRERSQRLAKMRELACPRCGATFSTTRGDKLYCSADCTRRADKARYRRHRRERAGAH